MLLQVSLVLYELFASVEYLFKHSLNYHETGTWESGSNGSRTLEPKN